MLELHNVSKSFQGTPAVKEVSFSIAKGEVVGFLGPNGAGKTTTMRMIAGVLEPDGGTIKVFGHDVVTQSLKTKARIGFLPENNPLYEDMLVSEYLDMAARFKRLSGSAKKKAIAGVVKETTIGEIYYRPIGELSKGFKQRVGLAQAIMHKPDLLILDEPTEGLDPNQRVGIRDLIKNLGRDRTVLVSTHVLSEVASTCNRVMIINQGTIVADGGVEELVSQSQGKRIITIEGEHISIDQLRAMEGIEILNETMNNRRQQFELSVGGSVDVRPLLFDAAKHHGWRLWELHEQQVSLEDVFRGLTK